MTRSTAEIQVHQCDNNIVIEKTLCSLTMRIGDHTLYLCDAANGTDWVSDKIILALQQAKNRDELAAVQRDIAAREFLESEMPLTSYA